MGKASALFFSQAQQTLHARVTPTPDQRDFLQDQWNRLADHLKASLLEKHSFPISTWIQGSYKYGTLIRPIHLHDDYDVDVGVYFEWEDGLVDAPTPTDLRTWVQLSLLNYKNSAAEIVEVEEPAKERCSRLVYADRFHIDTPVYHLARVKDRRRLACLGGEWEESDPKAIYKWFRDAFAAFLNAKTNREQARRIIRYLKAWAAVAFTSAAQSKPSSILITVLVCEGLVAEYGRRMWAMDDEVALTAVVRRIQLRLLANPVVSNPVAKKENLNRITSAYWDGFLVRLQALTDAADRAEVAENETSGALAWSEVFSFLMPLPDIHAVQVVDGASARRLMPVPDIEIRVLAKDKHAELSKHINTVPIVAAGSALTFSIMHPHAVPEFSTVEWTVRYCGVDPNMDGLLGQRKSGAALLSTTEHADREGPFSMDCVIRVSGSVYAVRRVPFHVGNSALPARSPLAETTVIRPSLASTWT